MDRVLFWYERGELNQGARHFLARKGVDIEDLWRLEIKRRRSKHVRWVYTGAAFVFAAVCSIGAVLKFPLAVVVLTGVGFLVAVFGAFLYRKDRDLEEEILTHTGPLLRHAEDMRQRLGHLNSTYVLTASRDTLAEEARQVVTEEADRLVWDVREGGETGSSEMFEYTFMLFEKFGVVTSADRVRYLAEASERYEERKRKRENGGFGRS